MKLQTRYVVAAVVVAVAAFILVRFLRHKDTPEEVVRQHIMAMAKAAEDKQVGDVVEHLSPRFRSTDGLSRDDVKRYLAALLFRGGVVKVFPTQTEFRLTRDDQVEFSGTFVLGRSPNSTLAGLLRESNVEARRIDATFEREADGEWRMVTAAHQPASQR